MDKLIKIYQKLFKTYGQQGWWPYKGKYNPKFKLRKRTPAEQFEICIGAILTQSTSWKNVELALQNLRTNNALNKKVIRQMPIAKLAKLIKSSGYNKQKAKKLKEFVKFLDSRKEISRENLLNVWGIGPETADSILLYAYDKPIFVIDAYTKRVFSRIGVLKENASYDEWQKLFMHAFKTEKNIKKKTQIFNEYHALIVELAKKHCRTKKQCNSCALKKFC